MARASINATRTFGVTVAVLVALFGCHSRTDPVVPEYLIGVWKTAARQYADRSFEITPRMMILNRGDDAVAINAIVAGAFTRAGGTAELHLFPPIGNDGHILLPRSVQVWESAVDEYLSRIGLGRRRDF